MYTHDRLVCMTIQTRRMPEDMWHKFKIICVKRNVSLNSQMIKLVTDYVEKAEKAKAKAPK